MFLGPYGGFGRSYLCSGLGYPYYGGFGGYGCGYPGFGYGGYYW